MANVQINSKLLTRNDSAANWTSVNPVLSKGEMGIEIDTNKMKIGDGATTWTNLPYFSDKDHIHGNISSAGTITSATVAPANGDSIIISDASNGGKLEKSITIGSSTSSFLRNDGTWATPPNNTYSAMGGATASAAGSAGLVPAPTAGKQDSYLKGDGTWAVPYAHPTGDGNLHVPATSTGNSGKVLTAGSTAGSLSWTTLPSGSTSASGMVQLNDTVSSTSTTQAATANAVKTAYDKANHSHPYAASSHTHTISNISDIASGVCSTAADTVAKTLSTTTFTLVTNSFILVNFTYGNTASAPTMDVNGTGAKPIFYGGAAVPTDLINSNDLILMMYDGTNWNINGVLNYATTTSSLSFGGTGITGTSSKVAREDHTHTTPSLPTATTSAAGIVQLNSTVSSTSTTQAATASAVKSAYDLANHSHPYAPTAHTHGIGELKEIATGECTTTGSTAAKTLTTTNFTLTVGCVAIVKFTYTNTAANPTLNVNGTGAKPIYFNGAAVSTNLIVANDILTLLYDGTAWHISGALDYGSTTTALSSGGTGAVGSSPQVARADHTHTLPAYPSVPTAGATSAALTNDGTSTAGSASTWSKSDHTHALPKLLGNHFTAANNTAMIALSTAKKGDLCLKADDSSYYVLSATPYSTLSNWTKIAGSAMIRDVGTSSGNIPVLDSEGKLSTSVIPSLSITNVYTATSQTAMLALSTAEVGDVCVRTDESKSYMLVALPATTAANWKDITNANAVSSVNGQTGAVSLSTSNISEGTNLYYTEARATANINSYFATNTIIFNGGNASGV